MIYMEKQFKFLLAIEKTLHFGMINEISLIIVVHLNLITRIKSQKQRILYIKKQWIEVICGSSFFSCKHFKKWVLNTYV